MLDIVFWVSNFLLLDCGRGSKKVFIQVVFMQMNVSQVFYFMKFIEDYCNSYISNSTLYNYNIRNLFKSCSIYIMPMVNPDGVDIVNRCISFSDSTAYKVTAELARPYATILFLVDGKLILMVLI